MKSLVFSIVAVGLIVLSLSVGEAVSGKPIVLYLPFEEGVGDTTADLSGNNPPGKLEEGAKWTVEGRFGNAIEFNGKGSYVEVQDNDILDPQNVTFEMWLKPNRFLGMPAFLSHCSDAAGWVGGWSIQANGAGQLWVMFPEPGNDNNILTQELMLELGKFQHLAVTFDGEEVKCYLNGELKDTFSLPITIGNYPGPLLVGMYGDGDHFTNGIIDEVVIYSAVLTQEEIRKDMETKNLVAVDSTGKLATAWGFVKRNAFD